MRVLVLPKILDKNPYQQELYKALEDLGVEPMSDEYRRNFPILRSARRHWPIDLVHIHWTHGFYAHFIWPVRPFAGMRFLFELFILKRLGVKIIWTVHNLADHERRSKWLDKRLNKALIWWCDRAIVHCERARQLAVQHFQLTADAAKKIDVVPHANYIGVYPDEVSKSAARDRLGLESSDFVYLFLGRIRPYKGVARLIGAFKHLKRPRLRLVIAGQPDHDGTVEEIEALTAGDDRIITSIGYVADNDIQYYMNACDVVVLPYEDILTSGSAVLAMSFKKAVILPDVGCNREMVGDTNGLLYVPGPERLEKAMMAALQVDLEEVGMENHRKIRAMDWTEMARQTRSVYSRA